MRLSFGDPFKDPQGIVGMSDSSEFAFFFFLNGENQDFHASVPVSD